MEKNDVIYARNILRKVKRTIEVYDRVTQTKSTKTVCYPIAIEFDNSMSLSEEIDSVMWNDTDGFVAGVMANSGQVRGGHYAIGRGEVINPAAIFMIDYGEIQQFRMVADKNAIDKFIKAIIADGKYKVNIDDGEVAVSNATGERTIALFSTDNPLVHKRKTSEEYVK